MQTQSTKQRWSRLRYASIAIVALAALLAGGGCEYLGLDQSGGGSKGDQQTNKQRAKKGKAQAGGGAGNESSGKQAKAGDEAKDDSSNEKKESKKPPSLSDADDEEEEEEKNRRRNPFAAAPSLRTGAGESEQEGGPKRSGPLQRYSYEKYRLAGLISETAVPKAMFIAPDGVGHVLKKGDRIGNEGGVIQGIRENEVELELPPEGEEGRPREATVELRKAEVTETEEREGLSEEEKKTLQRLLRSEQGRKAVRQQYKDRASGGSRQQQGGGFQGLEPPE